MAYDYGKFTKKLRMYKGYSIRKLAQSSGGSFKISNYLYWGESKHKRTPSFYSLTKLKEWIDKYERTSNPTSKTISIPAKSILYNPATQSVSFIAPKGTAKRLASKGVRVTRNAVRVAKGAGKELLQTGANKFSVVWKSLHSNTMQRQDFTNLTDAEEFYRVLRSRGRQPRFVRNSGRGVRVGRVGNPSSTRIKAYFRRMGAKLAKEDFAFGVPLRTEEQVENYSDKEYKLSPEALESFKAGYKREANVLLKQR